jgi:hypothetical protein
MDLTLDGITERVDLGEVWNAVRATYINELDVSTESSWYLHDDSIARYGRRELILYTDFENDAEAVARAQTELALSALPTPAPIAVGAELVDGLQVTAVGDAFLCNNKYITAGDGTTDDISDFVTDIITADLEFVSAGVIESNTLQIQKETQLRPRAWDQLLKLAEAGDANDDPWRVYIENDGRLNYVLGDNNPRYEWYGRKHGLVDKLAGSTPWAAKPGVLRNQVRRRSLPPSDTFLLDGRDVIINEVEMADGMQSPHLKPSSFNESEIWATQQYFARILQAEGVDSV